MEEEEKRPPPGGIQTYDLLIMRFVLLRCATTLAKMNLFLVVKYHSGANFVSPSSSLAFLGSWSRKVCDYMRPTQDVWRQGNN